MPREKRGRKKKIKDSRRDFNLKVRADFKDKTTPEMESAFLLPHVSVRYRNSKGQFAKLPGNGRKPKGWKRVEVTTYTDAQGKPAKKPTSYDVISSRSIQYREEGTRTWKNADKVDFRKKLYARVVEQTGDRKQPVKIQELNKGKSQLWTKAKKADTRIYLFPAIVPDRKLEIRLEGSTVKEALSKFNWEIAEWGEEVHIAGTMRYEYTDDEGERHRQKFAINLIEDWHKAPNMGHWVYDSNGEKDHFIQGQNTYGDILKTNLGIEIRRSFANQRVRFTTLDALADLYQNGDIPEEVYERLAVRDQAEKVIFYMLLSIRKK